MNDKLEKWDLSYFNYKDDIALKTQWLSTKESINKFVTSYKGKIADLNANELYKAIKKFEIISQDIAKICSFTFLNYTTDMHDPHKSKLFNWSMEIATAGQKDLVFMEIELLNLTDNHLNKLKKDNKKLNRYSAWLEHIRLYKSHVLSEKLEQLYNDNGLLHMAVTNFFDEVHANLIFKVSGKKLNEAQILSFLMSKDDKKRTAAGKELHKVIKDNIHTFSFVLNYVMSNKNIADRWRNYPIVDQARNLSNNIDDSVVHTMVEVVQSYYPKTSHRYYALKAKLMGKNKLNTWDRSAPIFPDESNSYSFSQAKDLVIASYSKFSTSMGKITAKFFTNNWIDVQSKVGKRGGAFAHPTVPDVNPYILLNFENTFRDVSTLAHEIGHGIHQYLAADQGFFLSQTPLTLAETASVFGETLLFDNMLKQHSNEQQKALLSSKIEDMLATIVRQVSFYEFELKIHNKRKSQHLDVETISQIWLSEAKKSMGDSFKYDEDFKYLWGYVPHFIHSPFYVYSYAFGNCLVNNLYYLYQKDYPDFTAKYISLLKAGGSKRYDKLLAEFGLDLNDRKFWENGMTLLVNYIEKFAKLVDV